MRTLFGPVLDDKKCSPRWRIGWFGVESAASSKLETTMGVLNGMLGNATKIDPDAAAAEYSRLLGQDEEIHAAYQLAGVSGLGWLK